MLNTQLEGFLFSLRKKKSNRLNKNRIKTVRNNKSNNTKPKLNKKNNNNKNKKNNNIKRSKGRLGDNITLLIAKITIHFKYNHRIDCLEPNKTDSSIFIKALKKTLVENYKGNNQLSSKIRKIFFEHKRESCLHIVAPFCTLELQKDIRTAFREIPLYEIYRNNIIKMSNIKLPIDPKRTIAVHLRLGDRADWHKWTSLQTKCFKNVIHSINNNIKIPHNRENTQCPINTKIIQKIINIAENEFPTHEVVIFCEPGSKCNLPYRCIQSTNPDDDLICLMLSDVLIGSHSNFSLSAFMFHEGSKAYLPMWGHHAFHGLGTKFDNTNVSFFNGYNGNILKSDR